MSTVDVSPESLRAQGRELNAAREEMVDNDYYVQLNGMGRRTNLSPGMFEAGAACQMRLDSHVARMGETFANLQISMIGLSSALHIVADVYGDQDQENAFRYAFVDPDAAVPPSLPLWVDKNSSFLNPPEDAETDGDSENPIVIPEETHNYLTSHDTSIPANAMYNGSPAYNYQTTTLHDGTRIVRTEVLHGDGSTDYYTTTYRPDGTSERSDEMSFGPQGRPIGWGDVGDWIRSEADAITDSPDRIPQD